MAEANDDKIAVHQDPVWRDRANFVIRAKLEEEGRWEQLWARQLSENRFEICCIPFFVYDLALGDEVETEPTEGAKYVVKQVVKDSGRYTFRVWSGDSHDRQAVDEVVAKAAELGCAVEWHSVHLIAISAEPDFAQQLANYLFALESDKRLEYEAGRTKHSYHQG